MIVKDKTMTERKKKRGFMDTIKGGLGHIYQIVSASAITQIAKGAEMIMKNIDDRIIRIEKRIIRKLSSLLVIGFGGVFLIFALFFFLKEHLGLSNSSAFFSIGITVFVIGLLLKIREPDG